MASVLSSPPGPICVISPTILSTRKVLTISRLVCLILADRQADMHGATENAGQENDGQENDGQKCRAGKCRTGK